MKTALAISIALLSVSLYGADSPKLKSKAAQQLLKHPQFKKAMEAAPEFTQQILEELDKYAPRPLTAPRGLLGFNRTVNVFNHILIAQVTAGSPCQLAGLKVGDKITAWQESHHDEPYYFSGKGEAEIAKLMVESFEGPVGSTVKITVVSGEEKPRILTIKRAAPIAPIDPAKGLLTRKEFRQKFLNVKIPLLEIENDLENRTMAIIGGLRTWIPYANKWNAKMGFPSGIKFIEIYGKPEKTAERFDTLFTGVLAQIPKEIGIVKGQLIYHDWQYGALWGKPITKDPISGKIDGQIYLTVLQVGDQYWLMDVRFY